MNLRFKFSLALILLMMLGSLTSFLIPYTQAKKPTNYYEGIADFYSDNLVRPSSNLLRHNIEENHKYFEAITFTALDESKKRWHITNLLLNISSHQIHMNISGYLMMKNQPSFPLKKRKSSSNTNRGEINEAFITSNFFSSSTKI